MYSPNDGVTSFSQWAQMPGSAAMAASRSRAGAHGLDVTEDVVQREARDGEGLRRRLQFRGSAGAFLMARLETLAGGRGSRGTELPQRCRAEVRERLTLGADVAT
jgi:hypothetical protein